MGWRACILSSGKIRQGLKHGVEYARLDPAPIASEDAVPLVARWPTPRPRSDGSNGPISSHSSSESPICSPNAASKSQR